MAGDWRGIPGNEHVLKRLTADMASGGAIGFVGAGASASLYPLWPQLIQLLADEAVSQGMASQEDRTFWCASNTTPQQAVQGIKTALGAGGYAQTLREIFGRRRGSDGNSYTGVHAALMRLPFRGFVTTNYDLGLVDARAAIRPGALSGYATWRDDDPVSRWLSEDIFREPCPILFAHGVCERTDTIVLGADEYRKAYATAPFSTLFNFLWGQRRLVFVGFGFSDPWLYFLSDAVVTRTAARHVAGSRHFAIIGLKQDEAYTPERRRSFRDAYNADPLFYPVSSRAGGGEDHSALLDVLQALVDEDRGTSRGGGAVSLGNGSGRGGLSREAGSSKPPPEEAAAGPSSSWRPTADQERLAAKRLAADDAELFRTALKVRFEDDLEQVMPAEPSEVVRWFAACPLEQAEQALDVVHAAVLAVREDSRDPGVLISLENAAVPLYCLAASRLVARAVHEQAAELSTATLIKVPTDENVICGIIAVALFGGELHLEEAEPRGGGTYPKAKCAFVVKPANGGDLVADDFERAAFLAVAGAVRGAPAAALDTGPLDNDQRGWLRQVIHRERKLRKQCLAFVVPYFYSAEACERFASRHSIPVLIHDKTAEQLLGMDVNTLKWRIIDFWRSACSGSAAAASPAASPPLGQ